MEHSNHGKNRISLRKILKSLHKSNAIEVDVIKKKVADEMERILDYH